MANQIVLDGIGTSGGRKSAHPIRQLRTLLAPATGQQSNALCLSPSPVACWRMDDVRFGFDSSFVLPGARAELRLLKAVIDENPRCPASVFGHADPTGDDEYNKQLSGRRAMSVYALVTRDTAKWEELFTSSFGGDRWGAPEIQIMLATVEASAGGASVEGSTTLSSADQIQAVRAFQRENGLVVDGIAGPRTREKLFLAYMTALCTDDTTGEVLRLDPRVDFLGHAADAGGKGDVQGCGEFNPVLVFSSEEAQQFAAMQDHAGRDDQNVCNRRVVVFLFPKDSRIDPVNWPCPRTKDGTGACRKRFWSDGERRRTPAGNRRLYERDRDTFACRFYDRLAMSSPCEGAGEQSMFIVRLCDGEDKPIKNARCRVVHGQRIISGEANENGEILVQALREPPVCTIEWGFPGGPETEFSYSVELFVDVDTDDADVAASRRLHNLGYSSGPTMSDDVRGFQLDHGMTETGQLADIRAKLTEWHDGGDPPRGD